MAKARETFEAPAEIGIEPLVDELIALIPGTDVEIAVLQRYGQANWKERMIAIRDKALELKGRIGGI